MVPEALASYVLSMIREIKHGELVIPPGVLDGIEVMSRTLVALHDIFPDVNMRSVINESTTMAWVTEVKHAMYKATIILDLCQLQAMTKRGSSAADGMGCFNPLLSCTQNYFYATNIGSHIKHINELFGILIDKCHALGFGRLPYRDNGGEVHTFLPRRVEMSPVSVVGEKIEEATKALVAEIIQTRKDVNNIAVVAIVGVGGIGKTTLANKVFFDEAIQGEFEKKIWLYISKGFNEVELLRSAILAAGGGFQHGKTLTVLQPILQAALTGKKLLLVMDDVWNHTAWNDVLEVPFVMAAAEGSRVLITTRDGRVAQRMRAEYPYHRVDKLGPEDAWSLMKKRVISSEIDEPDIDKLKDIGLQIIAKCGGLPHAVLVMALLLCQKERQQRDWEMVLNHYSPGYKIPKDIMYSMYFSYEDMSPCLKQCFLHYSLLPTNVVFYENDIIGMWISEGFVHGNSEELEELGRWYYDELILMNLIEMDVRYTSQRVCNMNDVVRSFAQFICRDEALVAHNGEIYDTSYLSSKIFYRMSLESKGLESDMLAWSLLQKQTSLRTLLSIGFKLGDSLIAFSTLRTLHIEYANAAALVESVCQLKHLRYLSVAHTDVSSLPESINKIKFLQHINLDGCEILEKIPGSNIKLRRLRYLNLNDTSITVIPQGFCGLTNLRKLYGFPAHMDGDWCSLEELGSFSQLREIGLKDLDNIAATSFAAKARLGEKVHLTYLKLGCTTRLGGDGLLKEGRCVLQDEENKRIESVFDGLYPPDCLRILDIQGYFALQLPFWMRAREVTLLKSLVVLTMEDLACCTQLPYGLCRLPHLKVLKIKRAPAISCVGPEFVGVYDHYTQTETIFPRLHELVFIGMVEWEEWVWEKQVDAQAMPVLEELLLDSCKLRSFPPGLAFHARALKRLVITAAPNLNSLDSFASVVELDLYFSPNLRSIANLLKLQKLTIVICPKLRTLIGVPAIQRLVLEAYDMKTLPRYLEDVSNLSLLQLDCSLELLNSIALGESGPEWEKFSHVKHIEAYAHDGDNRRKWYVFYTKDPYKLETNTSRPSSKLAGVSKVEDKLNSKDEKYILGTGRSSDSAVSKDDRELVGIDSPCEDLIKLLMHGDEKQLKMTSICGTGGLGKTIIAHAVYRKIENEFTCKAFIDMPRGPDIKVNIGSICAEVGCPLPKFEECGVQQLIDRLKIFFEEKRYLIVFDDIWDTSVWDQLLPALRENNHGSRIVITTRKVSVAEHVGGLYHLPLLSYNDSKMLFFRRTLFGSEDHCPSQFRELSKKMLSRCGQLPLAIIVMTNLLPKGMVLEGWQKVCDSIETGESMKNIRRVLKHSYDDLPRHLQECLLYLSIFPKGYKIRKDSLVQRWIVEGLISGKDGQNLQELGESYLSELVNSSMIEQIKFDSFGRDVAYHVPVTTLDLIVDLSIHEDFVTILPSLQRTTQSSNVQRLSLQDSNEQHDVLKATKTFGQVSSLSLFYGADLVQPLSKFQGLRVLDLEKCDSLKNEHLNGLGNLDKLRYLVLGSIHITKIPQKIGKLRHLQTLDLMATGVKELPSSIGMLTKLRRLLINRSTEVPEKIIGKLQALEELVEIDISKFPNILQEISTIPELRVISISLWSWDEHHTTLLSETLCKLATKKLKHLSIFSCCLLFKV